MDSRRLTSAVMVHAGAFVVAVLSLGKSPMHLGPTGSASAYPAPQLKTIEVRPLPPGPAVQVRRVEQPELRPFPAPVFDEVNPQEAAPSSLIISADRP